MLTKEQRDILEHTEKRAAGCRYCGKPPEMQSLVDLGYMRSLGYVAWCENEFFMITDAGRKAIHAAKGANRD